MTLLELLVKELSGAWPVEASGVVQDSTGQIWFFKNGIPYYTGSIWGADKESKDFDWVQWDLRLDLSVDNNFSIVTREQYESTIASQQPAWNGEGLPPIGSKVESFINGEWKLVKVVYTGEPGGEYEALVFDVKTTKPAWSDLFRPLRTEADRKRECVVDAILSLGTSLTAPTASIIYDAIAAGKIPGVELTK